MNRTLYNNGSYEVLKTKNQVPRIFRDLIQMNLFKFQSTINSELNLSEITKENQEEAKIEAVRHFFFPKM